MLTVGDVVGFLDGFAPPGLAAGYRITSACCSASRARNRQLRVMTCLTVTPEMLTRGR